MRSRHRASGRVEPVAVTLIIALATLLSAFWAFRVPMFLEPDEIAHADASFAYFDTGGPFAAVEKATTSNFVTPQVRYLMRATDYRRIRYDARAVVPRNYGSPGYFRGIDANAPAPTGVASFDGKLPYALVVYPSPYYGLMGTLMRAGWAAFDRSLVAAFFVARLANSAMLAATLAFAYLVLRELRFSLADRMLLLVGISFFPMSTWMSAYIQPDNQSALLLTGALYFALVLRRSPAAFAPLCALAVAESALGFTKLQYAVVAIVAFALALRGIFEAEPRSVRLRALGVGMLVPSLAAFAGRYLSPIGKLGAPPGGSAYAGLDAPSALRVAAADFARAAVDAFLGGASRGFWFRFGIRDEAALAGSFARDVTFALATLTLVVIAAWLIRQGRVARVLARARRIADIRRGLRFIGNDPLLNLYAMFSTLLFAAYAFSGGYLTLQGRYWYPMLVPIVVLSVRAIGGLARGRRARAAIRIACLFWAGFAIVTAPLAAAAMQHGFYEQTDAIPAMELGSIESVSLAGREAIGLTRILAPAGAVMTIRGVALDTSTGMPLSDVRYRIDGGAAHVAKTGRLDRSFAVRFDDPLLNTAGFRFDVPTARLRPGTHLVSVFAVERRAPAGLGLASLRFAVETPRAR